MTETTKHLSPTPQSPDTLTDPLAQLLAESRRWPLLTAAD